MRHLNIFDFDGSKIGTITWIDGLVFVCARSPREWNELNRLVHFWYKVPKEHPKFLEHVKEQAHNYDYATELIKD